MLITAKLNALQGCTSQHTTYTGPYHHHILRFTWAQLRLKLSVKCCDIVEVSCDQTIHILLEAFRHVFAPGFNGGLCSRYGWLIAWSAEGTSRMKSA